MCVIILFALFVIRHNNESDMDQMMQYPFCYHKYLKTYACKLLTFIIVVDVRGRPNHYLEGQFCFLHHYLRRKINANPINNDIIF